MLVPKSSQETLDQLCKRDFGKITDNGWFHRKTDGNVHYAFGKFRNSHNFLDRLFGSQVIALNNIREYNENNNYVLINGVKIIDSSITQKEELRQGHPYFITVTRYKFEMKGLFQDQIITGYSVEKTKEDAKKRIEQGDEQLWVGSLDNKYNLRLSYNRSALHWSVPNE
jgi:hypothetical protein